MDVGAIREAMRAQPFHPFSLRLAEGRELSIRHPDFIAISPDGWTVIVFSDKEPRMSILEPELIVSIERSTARSTAPAGGGPAAPSTDD